MGIESNDSGRSRQQQQKVDYRQEGGGQWDWEENEVVGGGG